MAFFEINWKPSTKELRKFAFATAAILAGLAAWVFWRHHLLGMDFTAESAGRVGIIMWSIAATCFTLGIVLPRVIKPLYLALTAVGLPIGLVVSYIILAVMYFAIFMPIGLIFRLIGRDALHRRFDPQARTYWSNYLGHPPAKRYFRQF